MGSQFVSISVHRSIRELIHSEPRKSPSLSREGLDDSNTSGHVPFDPMLASLSLHCKGPFGQGLSDSSSGTVVYCSTEPEEPRKGSSTGSVGFT